MHVLGHVNLLSRVSIEINTIQEMLIMKARNDSKALTAATVGAKTLGECNHVQTATGVSSAGRLGLKVLF